MANWFKNIFGKGSRSRAVVPAPPPTRTNIMYDAWQKVTNAPLTDFSPQELAGMKYSNRAGYMVELERLYSTMYHEWPTLQKDLSDVAESVAMLDWSVSPAVDDGGQPSEKAREVADVVSRAIWARLPQKPGTFTHGFLELIEAAVHGYYRGVNVHEIRWQFTKDLAFPAGFEPVWPQYYMWEMRCGEEDRLMMVPDGCDYSNPVPFPPHKFVLAMNNSGPDHPMYNGVLYSLLGYFLAAKCGLPWLQEYVLRYGHPVRKFKVQSKEDERKLREELELNDDLMDVFLRNGRELDITAIPAGANIPHEVLLKLAENMCHQVILGQTLTSDTSEDGGSRAQAQVHERVQNSVILKRAEWVCRLLNRGLVLDIVAMNYGEDALSTLPLPEIKCSLPDEGLNIDRVQVCKELLAIPGFAVAKSFIYEFLRIPMPAEGEDTFNTPEPPAHDHGGFGGLFGGFGGNTPPDGGGTPHKGTEDGTEDKREDNTPTPAQQRENERKSEQEGVNAANTDPASMAREHDAATMALLPRVANDWMAPALDKLEDMLQAGMSPQEVYARLHELTPNTAALEQAMEAIFTSALGVQTADGVQAENPYGCNQYGEGWAEPHNGNSTGYKNMSPFNPHAPASKVLTNEADGNTVEQSTHSKYVGKDAYPDASNKGRDKEAEDAKREEAEKKAKAEAERKAKEEAAKKKAEEEAKKKAEEEARKKAEAEAKKKAELEAKRKAEAEKKKQEAEKKKDPLAPASPPEERVAEYKAKKDDIEKRLNDVNGKIDAIAQKARGVPFFSEEHKKLDAERKPLFDERTRLYAEKAKLKDDYEDVCISERIPELRKELDSAIGQQFAGATFKKLEEAPEAMRNMFSRYAPDFGRIQSTRGNSECSGTTVYLNPKQCGERKLYDGGIWAREGDTALHETGHAIDMAAKYRKKWSTEPSYELKDPIKEDTVAFMEKSYQEARDQATELVKKFGGKYSVELADAIADAEGASSYNRSYYKMGEDYLPTLYKDVMGIKVNGKKLRVGKVTKAYYASKKLREADPLVIAAVCDAFKSEGCNTVVGHSDSYYKKFRGYGGAIETWANLFMASVNNDTKVIDGVKNLLPRTYEKFIKIVDELNK